MMYYNNTPQKMDTELENVLWNLFWSELNLCEELVSYGICSSSWVNVQASAKFCSLVKTINITTTYSTKHLRWIQF